MTVVVLVHMYLETNPSSLGRHQASEHDSQASQTFL